MISLRSEWDTGGGWKEGEDGGMSAKGGGKRGKETRGEGWKMGGRWVEDWAGGDGGGRWGGRWVEDWAGGDGGGRRVEDEGERNEGRRGEDTRGEWGRRLGEKGGKVGKVGKERGERGRKERRRREKDVA